MAHPNKQQSLRSHREKSAELCDGYKRGGSALLEESYHKEHGDITPNQEIGVPVMHEHKQTPAAVKSKYGKV